MSGRTLGPEERTLWNRVAATTRPMDRRKAAPRPPADPQAVVKQKISAPQSASPAATARGRPAQAANTLDGSWDRRLMQGRATPDMVVDLHGHTLDSAWRLLDHSLARAVSDGARMLLLITGRPPANGREGRGAIRRAVPDWIAASAYGSKIAAVRHAHPRHGGAGALYVIFRRQKSST